MTSQATFLRQASTDDLDLVTQYTCKLHRHEDDHTIAQHQNFHSNLKNWLALELENPRSLFIIAEKNNQPVGFIGATSIINDNGFLANPIKGVIQLLWIDLEFRKLGIAEKILDEVEHCFKELGIEHVECTYTARNHLAESFWKKKGYQKNSITARKLLS